MDAYASEKSDPGSSVPVRAVLSTCWPPVWAEAQRAGWGSTLAALVAVSGVCNVVRTGTVVFGTVWLGLRHMALDYDANFDPVVWDHSGVHLEGPRAPRLESTGALWLVDPSESVALAEIPQPQYVIVRRDAVHRRDERGGLTRHELPVGEPGDSPVIVNSASLGWWNWAFGVPVGIAIVGFVTPILVGFELLGCGFLAAIAAVVVGLILPDVPYAERARVAVATSTATLVPALVLSILGARSDCVVELFWLAMIASGAAAALWFWGDRSAVDGAA